MPRGANESYALLNVTLLDGSEHMEPQRGMAVVQPLHQHPAGTDTHHRCAPRLRRLNQRLHSQRRLLHRLGAIRQQRMNLLAAQVMRPEECRHRRAHMIRPHRRRNHNPLVG